MARSQSNRGGNPQAAGLAAGRGLLIVLFAAAIGVLLLARAVDPQSGENASESGAPAAEDGSGSQGDGATAPSVASTTTASTIPAKKEPQDVVVLVANGRGVAGAAKANADALNVQNYNVLAPTDYPANEPTTTVYFTEGYQADAIAVAQLLTIEVARVTPMPANPLPLDTKNANVVVVLGTDGKGLSPS